MQITLEQFQQMMPRMKRLPSSLVTNYLPSLNAAMAEAEINTPKRIAAFLAQIAHESGEFRYMSEEWGPTPTQARYDPPSKLAVKLGNTKVGDGYTYRGAGPLQLTGRSNFKQYGDALGIDLENQPELAREFGVGIRLACLFWTRHNLNALADIGDFKGITKEVNGGYNGLSERQSYWENNKIVLGV